MFDQLDYNKVCKIISILDASDVIIHIRRENLLESLVSLKIRQKLSKGVFLSNDNINISLNPLHIDYKDVFRLF
ncbi:MAG: hypothetical protein N3A01_02770 [Bacteroidales bacterium]|nr:hypothetical protein [Bacteroidales bacterium]